MQHNQTLRVEMRFKNARLYNAILERTANINTDIRDFRLQETLGPVVAFCEQHGLTKSDGQMIYKLLNLKLGPTRSKGGFGKYTVIIRPICVTLANLLDRDIEWLFPNELYAHAWPRMISKDIDGARFLSLREAPRTALLLPADQETNIIQAELRQQIRAALKTLTPREEKIIIRKFGLNGEPEQGLEEISNVFGVSRERIRQIEAKALRKLRHPSRTKRLRPFIGPSEWTIPAEPPEPLPILVPPHIVAPQPSRPRSTRRILEKNLIWRCTLTTTAEQLPSLNFQNIMDFAPREAISPRKMHVRVHHIAQPGLILLIISGVADRLVISDAPLIIDESSPK